MTPTQQQAKEALQQMKFRVEKQNQWDEKHFSDKAIANPDQKGELLEQMATRKQQRVERIAIFSNLLQEAVTATDQVQSMYVGFVSGCNVPDVFALTEDQTELLSADQLITIGYANRWRQQFLELSRQQAIYYAITKGCVYMDQLHAIRNGQPAPSSTKPKTVKITRKWHWLAKGEQPPKAA